MARNLVFLWAICGLLVCHHSSAASDGLQMTLKNYCESWRMNVELNNIKNFDVVPDECVPHISKYMTSTQYKVDSEMAIEQCRVYVSTSTSCGLMKDGRDAWIFDIDDTLLSTLPYYEKNGFGGKKMDTMSFEEWMEQGKAPVLEHSLKLFNELKGQGVQIILVSSRRECLRSATVDNLVHVGYRGWTSLVLRGGYDEGKDVGKYKADVRKPLIGDGYRIWGILGDQWSSIEGVPSAERSFKLPNPLYYVA